MPQLIKPGTVKVMTHDGELRVEITLELNINLNTDVVKVAASAKPVVAEQEEDKTAWAIPEFTPTKIEFGKRE
jgi:hypothetical protein